ncbi:MAG: hypothetical protein FWF81_08165 [Defluviitaleaceae bacterium]|nr:hypothetical protein [Defluviitaleaceae bacterium]
MKRRMNYISILLALLFTLCMPTAVVSAFQTVEYTPIQPLWQNVSNATALLTHSGTSAHCSLSIVGLPGTTRITATMRLERVTGNNVSVIRTWTHTVNASHLAVSESAGVTANGTYRLQISATVVRNGVSEHISFMG